MMNAEEASSATPKPLKAKEEGRMQVRSEKSCVTGGESPSSLEAELPEFRTKVMDGKV
jgi:hypothetical protein